MGGAKNDPGVLNWGDLMGKDVTDPEGLMLLQEGSERERDGKFCLTCLGSSSCDTCNGDMSIDKAPGNWGVELRWGVGKCSLSYKFKNHQK